MAEQPDVPHYANGEFFKAFGVQPITFTRYMTMPAGAGLKYVARYLDKGTPYEDLTKALDYLNWAKADFLHLDVWPVLSGFENHLTIVLKNLTPDPGIMWRFMNHLIVGEFDGAVNLVANELDRTQQL